MRKWLIISLLVLVFVAGAGVTAALLYLRHNYPPEKLAVELESQLSRRSGFAVRINSVDFTWSGRIRIGSVCARNAEMKSGRCFVQAENIVLQVSVLALIRKQLQIEGVRVGTIAMHFFEEVSHGPGAAKTVIHSWEAKRPASIEAPGAGDGAAFSVAALQVDSGEIVRDVPISVLPAGTTRFNLRYAGGQPATVESTLFFSPRGEAKFALAAQSENFVGAMLQLARRRQLPAGAGITGDVACDHCPVDFLDSRIRHFGGKVQLQITGENLVLQGQDALLSVSAPLPGEFRSSFKLPLMLRDFSLDNGEVGLAKAGLSVQLVKVHRSAGTGFNADFSASAQLAALGISGVSGELRGGGRIMRGVPGGTFSVSGFAYPVRSNLVISSARFDVAMQGDFLSVKGGKFLLNESAFIANLSLLRAGAATKVTGNVSFPSLDMLPLVEGGNDTPGAAAATPGGKADVALRVDIGELRAGKWKLNQLKGDFAMNATGMQIENATAGVAQGRVQFGYRKPRDGAQSLRLQAQDIRSQVVSDNLALPGTIYGILNVNASLQFNGSSTDAIRRSLTGNLHADLGRGKIKNSFLQKGILTGPLHKLEDKFSDIEFAAGSLDARFAAGAMEIRKLWFDAEEWNAQWRAEADSQGQGKAALNFRFRSSFVENAANPLHIGISSRKDGDFYDLPFACRGNVLSGACYKQNW